uniref:Uncharacterized protein n=1 Tax=Heterorhabditis bacteriophora TaxID=37862 RepID=A0A1I7WFP3_HETBA
MDFARTHMSWTLEWTKIASGALNGTDPPLLFPLPVIYTTRPPEDCVHHFDER